ncbi:hypothetical protein [Streptomyces sp. 1331.2]|nr:hypothetical protein [Streptomyces sp. 1331.2]
MAGTSGPALPRTGGCRSTAPADGVTRSGRSVVVLILVAVLAVRALRR